MDEINKFLTEAMGNCWHRRLCYEEALSLRDTLYNWVDFDKSPMDTWYCSCGRIAMSNMHMIDDHVTHYQIDLATWDGFGKLWEWSNKQDWWKQFNGSIYFAKETVFDEIDVDEVIYWDYINPENFSKALFIFLKEKE